MNIVTMMRDRNTFSTCVYLPSFKALHSRYFLCF